MLAGTMPLRTGHARCEARCAAVDFRAMAYECREFLTRIIHCHPAFTRPPFTTLRLPLATFARLRSLA